MDDDARIDDAIALTRDRQRDQIDTDDVPGVSAGPGERQSARGALQPDSAAPVSDGGVDPAEGEEGDEAPGDQRTGGDPFRLVFREIGRGRPLQGPVED